MADTDNNIPWGAWWSTTCEEVDAVGDGRRSFLSTPEDMLAFVALVVMAQDEKQRWGNARSLYL